MLRAGQVVKLFQTHEIDQFLVVFEEQLKTAFEEQIIVFNKFIETELKKHSNKIQPDTHGKFAVQVHCAAHTLELCQKDTMKVCVSEQKFIDTAHSLIKKLRTDNINNVIVLRGLPKPNIDCETRWGSVHEMLQSLISLKDFCIELSLLNDDFKTTDDFWPAVERIVKVVKIPSVAVVKLQRSDIVLSEVYGIFLVLKHQLEQMPDEPIAVELINQIIRREPMILKTTAMFACMYLDPRYQCMLDESEMEIAKTHLAQLYERIGNVRKEPTESPLETPLESNTTNIAPNEEHPLVGELLLEHLLGKFIYLQQ